MTAAVADAAGPTRAVHVLGGATMGTLWQVSIVAPAGADLHGLHDGIQACLDGVVAQMSTWEPGSDICRYNRAPPGSWQVLPQPFFDVLREALAIASESGGACDPTVGPLVSAWGFGPGGCGGAVPDAAGLALAHARVGWRQLLVEPDTRRVFQPGGVALDLSGIAKGHGVDAVVDWLRARGIAAALVEVGGELRGYGRKPGGSTWQVLAEPWPADDGVEDMPTARRVPEPEPQSEPVPQPEPEPEPEPCILALEDAAVATSGDHWHRFEHDGREYAHTIDPRTGRPVDHAAAAVTVVAASALAADAWATALTVLGIEQGLALAERRGIAARFVLRSPRGPGARESSAFQRYRAA